MTHLPPHLRYLRFQPAPDTAGTHLASEAVIRKVISQLAAGLRETAVELSDIGRHVLSGRLHEPTAYS